MRHRDNAGSDAPLIIAAVLLILVGLATAAMIARNHYQWTQPLEVKP